MKQNLNFENINSILERNDIEFAGIFGSHARGEAKKDSDIDMLVRFSKSKGLFDLLKAERELSQSLQKQVDLVTQDSLSPYFKKDVINNLHVVYEN